MLGQDATDVQDVDSISLDELIISDTTEESAVKCRNIPVPSNSPDLIEQVRFISCYCELSFRDLTLKKCTPSVNFGLLCKYYPLYNILYTYDVLFRSFTRKTLYSLKITPLDPPGETPLTMSFSSITFFMVRTQTTGFISIILKKVRLPIPCLLLICCFQFVY